MFLVTAKFPVVLIVIEFVKLLPVPAAVRTPVVDEIVPKLVSSEGATTKSEVLPVIEILELSPLAVTDNTLPVVTIEPEL